MPRNKQNIGNQNLPKNNQTKIVISPFEKLKRRILKEFQKKKLIGDIIINEDEYNLLISYFIEKCKALINSDLPPINDPIFAVALVQIGIKYYDGNFWGHVAEILGLNNLTSFHQGLIGTSFTKTLSKNNKVMLDEVEKRVNNILMHGFVSDYYANEMFDFLFKYYNLDLERDLERNNREMMNNLIKTIQRKDNTGRTYLLVKQTADAISSNIRGGKIRIRRLLKLIDKCFWEQTIPINPTNRLSILFNSWQEASSEFKLQFNKYHNNMVGGGKKSYSSPYLKCDFYRTKFKLILPTQLIKFEYDKDVKWNIYCNGKIKTIKASLYPAVTGYKTESIEVNIEELDIFNEFMIELASYDNRIRLFKIKADCIRFFDRDGDFINLDSSIPKGEVYSFTRENEVAMSEALIESEPIGGLLRSYFEFEYGDIVRLPNGTPISIGKKIEEGLLSRMMIQGCYVQYNDVEIPIYKRPPTILLKIAPKRSNGTVIIINGRRHRLFDGETIVIDLKDRSGETGYILRLSDYGCAEDDIYTVYVDVPNDRTNRCWQFALINNFNYEFEDAPYIFKTKGTIRFNEDLVVNSVDDQVKKNSDENSFNFDIKPDVDYLHFAYDSKERVMNIHFYIPAFKWKFDKQQWNVEKPSDIWHSDFPSLMYFKYPDDRVKLSMEEQMDYENSSLESSATYFKSKSKGIFECDTTRFKSWFGREKVLRRIFIDFPGNRAEFIRVITRSVVNSHILKGDFQNSKLIGQFEIIGCANYYADIIILDTNTTIVEKIPIIDGKFSIDAILSSGIYKVCIFEDEEDDTGFGVANYLPIGEFEHELINPYDLRGKNIALRCIKRGEDGIFQMQLNSQYIICNLQRIDEENRQVYKGALVRKSPYGNKFVDHNVKVEFLDLNKLNYVYLTYHDGYDFLEFLYDTNKKIIVKEEEQGLKWAVRYRRYESLYREDFVYVVEFTNETPNIIEEVYIHNNRYNDEQFFSQKDNRSITIEEMGLTKRTYNCLHRAKIKTVKDILNLGEKELFKIRNLGRSAVDEILLKLSQLGFVGELKGPSVTGKERHNIEQSTLEKVEQKLKEKKCSP